MYEIIGHELRDMGKVDASIAIDLVPKGVAFLPSIDRAVLGRLAGAFHFLDTSAVGRILRDAQSLSGISVRIVSSRDRGSIRSGAP